MNSGQVDPGKILILAPRRQLGYAVRNALNDLGTSSHSFFNEEVFEGKPQNLQESIIQQAFTLLTLLANADDIVALRCWCGYGSNSLRSGAWSRIRNYCESSDLSPKEVLELLSTNSLTISNTKITERFRELQVKLEHLQDLRGRELVNSIFPEEDWAVKIREYVQIDEDDDCDAQTLLERIKTKVIQMELPTDVEYVRVMSLHKSKGLTADMVIVLGCIAGMIPAIIPQEATPSEQQKFIEEQRRLFFVALTRTRQTLVLSSISTIPRDIAHRMRVPVRGGDITYAMTRTSMFIRELGSSAPQPITGNEFLEELIL